MEEGDLWVFLSDGLVEATDTGDQVFGFDRLEESLRRHAIRDVDGLRDGVLGDLKEFAGSRPLDDDLTVLVLQLP